jgi:hypothetical protein
MGMATVPLQSRQLGKSGISCDPAGIIRLENCLQVELLKGRSESPFPSEFRRLTGSYGGGVALTPSGLAKLAVAA